VRDLAKLLARRSYKIVCIDFEDWLGDAAEVRCSALPSLAVQPILIQAGGGCARGGLPDEPGRRGKLDHPGETCR
jgi:hypothetical protein